MEAGLQARPRYWKADAAGASMSDEKKKSKLTDDPNPQLPPPPLSRARLAAKGGQVFAENLPVSKNAKGASGKARKAPGESLLGDSRPQAKAATQRGTARAPSPPLSKPIGRPPGKKPPKTLAERQQAFRDRKRKEKK